MPVGPEFGVIVVCFMVALYDRFRSGQWGSYFQRSQSVERKTHHRAD